MTASTAETQPIERGFAGVISRGSAAVIDVCIFIPLSFFTLFIVQGARSMINQQQFGQAALDNGVSAAIISFLMLVYFAGAWAIAGHTIGEGLMGLTTVRNDGRRVKLLRAIARFFFAFVSFAALGLGFAWMLIDRRRRTWQDIVARTVVIYDFDEQGVHHRRVEEATE